jgi:NADH-quinone oxidoreductase subunit B
VTFYVVAMLFVMFDIELIFIYPYAVDREFLGSYGFVEMLAFSVIFFGAFVYVVSRGAIDWGPCAARTTSRRRRLRRANSRHHHPACGHRGSRRRNDGGMSLIKDVRNDGLGGLEHNVITARIEDLVKWSRSRSSWPASFGLACCAIEMMATGAAHYDLSRFGMEVFRASPRQADIMIVAGRVSQKMAPVLRQVYDQMMEPKWVISMGVCASSGGMFNNYAIVQGVDQVVPVDVYAPGCPPTPETLIHAIETLHQLIEDGHLMKRRAESGAGANVHVQEIPAGAESIPVLLGTR